MSGKMALSELTLLPLLSGDPAANLSQPISEKHPQIGRWDLRLVSRAYMCVRVTFVGGACGSQGQGDVRCRWVESCRWSLCKRMVSGACVN